MPMAGPVVPGLAGGRPHAVIAQRRLEQVECAAGGGREHGADVVAPLAGQAAPAGFRFRRLEMLFSAIWGLALLAECIARLVGDYTLPVTTMVWLSTALTLGAVGAAIVVSGAAAGPIQKMIETEGAGRPGFAASRRQAPWCVDEQRHNR